MALAVTHVLITIVVLDLLRHYVFGKKHFPRYLIVVGGVAGLAPDFDIVISWIVSFFSSGNVDLHGVFSHSLTFVLLFGLIGIIFSSDYVFKHKADRRKWSSIFFVIAFGWTMHLFLDCLYGGYKSFLWPLQIATNFCPQWGVQDHAASIDAILLILWIVHEEMHGYVRDWF